MVAPLVVGRYRVYDPIAAGGMAAVHFARLIGEAGFARTVAIKRLHPQRWGETALIASLVDEARLASRIKHPNVVPTLDVFMSGGELFVVMEYVIGESFARLLRGYLERSEPLPVPIAVGVAVGVLHGLHAAHEAKSELGAPLEIVHRDVSPQNVIVGVDGLPRVLDFGIAKASKSAERLSSTTAGQIKGKIRYMAPEQVRAEAVSPATDVFAAGIVLWEALAGRRLHKSEADVARAYAFKERPERLSALNPAVSAALSDVIDRAMRPEPSDRWQDALSFASALEETAEVAPARRISEWVRSTAGEALREREQKLAEIERDSALRPRSGASEEDHTDTDISIVSTTASEAAEEPKGADELPREGDGTATALASRVGPRSSDSRTAAVVAPASPRRVVWLAAIAAVLGAALGAVVFYESGGGNASAVARDAPLGLASNGAAPADAALPPRSEESAAPRSASSSLPSSSVQSAEVAASVARPAAGKPVGRPAPSVPSGAAPVTEKPASPCNPPYTVDSRGVQRFKKECL